MRQSEVNCIQGVQKYNILSLSGGGFRGLFTIVLLEELEKRLGSPLAKHFDLIAGTSIGGIIALAIACEIPTGEIKKVFLENAHEIFDSKGVGILNIVRSFFYSKYSSEGLERVIKKFFEDKKVSDLKNRILVTAVDVITGRGRMFKTPHNSKLMIDKDIKLIDVALATSAAPTYFPPHKIDGRIYVDGAIVGNDPSLFAVHEIQNFIHPEQVAEVANKVCDIGVLSIGTMEERVGLTKTEGRKGLWYWLGFYCDSRPPRLVDLMFSAQRQNIDDMLKHLLKDNYWRIDADSSSDQGNCLGLDKFSLDAIQILTGYAKSKAQEVISSDKMERFINHKPLMYVDISL